MNSSTGAGSRFSLRLAVLADAPTAADLYLCARHTAVPDIPPLLHSDEEVRRWVQDVVIPQGETWLAENDGVPIAMMVLDGELLDQLYVHPKWTGRGVGSELVRLAQSRRPERLSLWTFQSNHRAQRFYERHGFVAMEYTDGQDNEEREPDVRYVWQLRQEAAVLSTR